MVVERQGEGSRAGRNATRAGNEAGAPGGAAARDPARCRPERQRRSHAPEKPRYPWAWLARRYAHSPQAQTYRRIWRWRLRCRPDDAGNLATPRAQCDFRAERRAWL